MLRGWLHLRSVKDAATQDEREILSECSIWIPGRLPSLLAVAKRSLRTRPAGR